MVETELPIVVEIKSISKYDYYINFLRCQNINNLQFI